MSHLLLVDDNADHLFLTRRALRGAGIETTGVQTAEAAIEAIQQQRFDMILLDHNLPGMKGAQLIASIRARGFDTPVVMVTGGGSEQLAVDALKSGALDYIVKTEGYLTSLAPRIQRAISQHQLEIENRKLESERQAAVAEANEHARRLKALQQASVRINGSLRPRDVRTQAVNQAAALLDTDMAAFFLLREDGLSLQIAASCNLSVSYADTLRVKVGEGAIGRAVLQGEPIALTDAITDERFKDFAEAARREGYRAVLAAPLLMRGDAQGGITVYDREPRAWKSEEIALLQTLAQNVVVAYENAQLYDRLRSRVTELTTLNRIVTSLTTSSDLGAALETVVSHLLQLFGAASGAILLRDPFTRAYRALGVGSADNQLRDALGEIYQADRYHQNNRQNGHRNDDLSESLAPKDDRQNGHQNDDLPRDASPADSRFNPLEDRELRFVPDILFETSLSDYHELANTFGFRALCSVPLIPQDEPIGALQLFFKRRRRLDQQERELLETVANAAAVAVQRGLLQDSLLRQEAERLALIESSRLKTEFISTVSHELRTPLASIEGYVKLILAGHCGPVAALQEEFLQTVDRNSRRLSSLVDDLLDVSRIESGTLALEREPVDLGAVVAECVQMIAPQAEARRMEIRQRIQPDLPTVSGDFRRLGEVVTNYLSNAIKYGTEGTPIEVSVEREDAVELRLVVVRVRDYGIGIAPEEMPNLFRKFYRVDNSSTRLAGGTGLGLAIAKHLVELHGGKVWAESEPGIGSVFSFSIPACVTRTEVDQHAEDTGY